MDGPLAKTSVCRDYQPQLPLLYPAEPSLRLATPSCSEHNLLNFLVSSVIVSTAYPTPASLYVCLLFLQCPSVFLTPALLQSGFQGQALEDMSSNTRYSSVNVSLITHCTADSAAGTSRTRSMRHCDITTAIKSFLILL